MAIIRKIVSVLAHICYILIGIYALACVPLIFGYKPLVVLTGSMEPTFKTGSLIYYKQASFDELSIGDIITFKIDNGKYLVSHRIHDIKNNKFETKGDANDTVDAVLIDYKDVVGKDSKINIPYIGYYIRLINESIILVITIVMILVSEFLLSNIETIDINKKMKGGLEDES